MFGNFDRASTVQTENTTNSYEKELIDLKTKHEDLKSAYSEALKELDILKKNSSPTTKKRKSKKEHKTMNVDPDESNRDVNESCQSDEEILLASKSSGFERVSPQSESLPKQKDITCKVCKLYFTSKTELDNHIVSHTDEGDWHCEDCSFQSNSEINLEKHVRISQHTTNQPGNMGQKDINNITCNFCQEKFPQMSEMVEHRQKAHKTFKPCRNLPNCQYNDCLFNHEPIDDKTHQCFECGEKFETFSNLMFHRKNKHSMNKCLKFLKNNCMFNDNSCWYDHATAQNKTHEYFAKMKSPDKGENVNERSERIPVFWDPRVNMDPPSGPPMGPPPGPKGTPLDPLSGPPSQATWLRMISMVKELNMMMMNLKKTNLSRSL